MAPSASVTIAFAEGEQPPVPSVATPALEVSFMIGWESGTSLPAVTKGRWRDGEILLPPPNDVILAGLPPELAELWQSAWRATSWADLEHQSLGDEADERIAECQRARCPDLARYRREREALDGAPPRARSDPGSAAEQLAAHCKRPSAEPALLVACMSLGTYTRSYYPASAPVLLATKPSEPLGLYARYLDATTNGPHPRLDELRALLPDAHGVEAVAIGADIAYQAKADESRRLEALRAAEDELWAARCTEGWRWDAVAENLLFALATADRQGDRLRVATELLQRGARGSARESALSHAARAVVLLPPPLAVVVPQGDVAALAARVEEEARLVRRFGVARAALEILMREAPTATEREAAASRRRDLEGTSLATDEDLETQTRTLVEACHLAHPTPEPAELWVTPAEETVTVRVKPDGSPFAQCLAQRAPALFADAARPLHAKLAGYDPIEAQMATLAYVIVGTHRTLADAKRALPGYASRLGLPIAPVWIPPGPEADLGIDPSFLRDPPPPVTEEQPSELPRRPLDCENCLTIEASGTYGWAPGVFLVVALSVPEDSPEVAALLARAKRARVPAYVKKARVYMGCRE